MESTERISADELMRKLRTKEDRINIAREMGYYLPSSPGFDVNFFLLFLQGKKKLLELGQVNGYAFPFFTRTNSFTKDHLLQLFVGDEHLEAYLPTDICLKRIDRNYLFSVLAVAAKEKYLQIYSDYKTIINEREGKQWNKYELQVPKDTYDKLKQYQSSSSKKNVKPLRLRKNGVSCDILQEKEKKILKEKKIPRMNERLKKEKEKNTIDNIDMSE